MKLGILCTLFGLVLMSSCNSPSKQQLLTGDNYKFWDYEKDSVRQSFLFSKNGDFFLYNINPFDGVRSKFYNGDLILADKWRFKGADTIIINNERYGITKLTEDSLEIVLNGFGIDTFTCIKSSNQKMPKD